MPIEFDEERKIVFIDYRGLKGEGLLQEIKHTHEEGRRIFNGEKAHVLVDVTQARLDIESVKALKESNKRDKDMIGKTAIIGITGLKKVLANAIAAFSGNESKNFDTKEQAIGWLMR